MRIYEFSIENKIIYILLQGKPRKDRQILYQFNQLFCFRFETHRGLADGFVYEFFFPSPLHSFHHVGNSTTVLFIRPQTLRKHSHVQGLLG